MARHPKPINWEQVKVMVTAGMSAKNIALNFDIDFTNFYDRFLEEFGESFTNYTNKCKGNDSEKPLKVDNALFVQYTQAMKGNNKMLEKFLDEFCGQGKGLVTTKAPNQPDIDKDHIIYDQQNQIAELKKNGDKPETE